MATSSLPAPESSGPILWLWLPVAVAATAFAAYWIIRAVSLMHPELPAWGRWVTQRAKDCLVALYCCSFLPGIGRDGEWVVGDARCVCS